MVTLTVLLFAGLQKPTVFDRIFPHPTGSNAVEDYVRAGDMMDQGMFQVYQTWTEPESRPSPQKMQAQREARERELAQMTPDERKQDALENPPQSAEELELIEHVGSLNYYKLKEEEVQRFSDCLDYLIQGNRKAISFDFQRSFDISWLSSARKLARLSSDAAFVAFAEGQPARGSQFLNEALVMSMRIGGDSIIGELSGIGNGSIALSRYNEFLGALSLAECQQIPPLVGQLLNNRDVLESMLHGERSENLRSLDAMLKSFRDEGSADYGVAMKEFRGMSPEQQAAWESQIVQSADSQFAVSASIFELPEENWLPTVGPEPIPDPTTAPTDDTNDSKKETLSQVGDDIKDAGNMTEHRQYLLSIMRNRTQLRLLRLHARIIEHRWKTGELPKSIADMKLPKDETSDPLSGKPFQYVVKDRTYRLFSFGVPETGVIELRYRRQSGGSGGTAPAISP